MLPFFHPIFLNLIMKVRKVRKVKKHATFTCWRIKYKRPSLAA